MAHEITATDSFVGYLKGGWHGLGRTFTEQIRSAADALRLSGLGWEVEQFPLQSIDPRSGVVRQIGTHVENVRTDTRESLGVVGAGYVPCQNADLATFAYEVAKESGETLHLETAGSIRGGRRVWFMLAGVRFEVNGNERDPVDTFLLAANGHDGGMTIRVQPTTTRVVCSNTLHMALSESKRQIRLRHEGNLSQKIAQAQSTLKLYTQSVKDFRAAVETLDAKAVNKDAINQFFIEAWTKTEFAIPKNPVNEKEQKQREKAMEAYTMYCRNVDEDATKTGRRGKPSLWNAFNGLTQWQQHQRTIRAANDAARNEARAFNDLFGSTAESKQTAFAHALSMV